MGTQTPWDRRIADGAGAEVDNGWELVMVSCWLLSSSDMGSSREEGTLRKSCKFKGKEKLYGSSLSPWGVNGLGNMAAL